MNKVCGEPSKIHGTADCIVGAAKENTGYLFGNPQLQSEGEAQRAAGNAEYQAAQAVQAADATKDKLVGKTKDLVGSTVGNESLEAKGKAQNAEGHLKDATNI
jgi:uncharacterized protein YjbJ (UPF0337 family)